MKIINLTQHKVAPEQIEYGVFDSQFEDKIRRLITFDEIPTFEGMEGRANQLANIALDEDADGAMIGGAPYFQPILEKVLFENGIKPMYAFSKRVSEDKILEDGTITKISVFKHEGFFYPKDIYK